MHPAVVIFTAKADLRAYPLKDDIRRILQRCIFDAVGLKSCIADPLLQQEHGVALAPKTVQQYNLLLRIRIVVERAAYNHREQDARYERTQHPEAVF